MTVEKRQNRHSRARGYDVVYMNHVSSGVPARYARSAADGFAIGIQSHGSADRRNLALRILNNANLTEAARDASLRGLASFVIRTGWYIIGRTVGYLPRADRWK